MDEEMFFMAPSGSDPEDRAGDTDSDDMFLSAHDDLSPLAPSLEPLDRLPGGGTAPGTPAPAQPGTDGTAVPQDRAPTPGPCPTEGDAPGEGEHPGDPTGVPAEGVPPGTSQSPGERGGGEGAADGGSVPSRTESSADAGPGDGGGGAGGPTGAGGVLDPHALEGGVEENGADTRPPTPEEPGEGEPQPSPGSPPATSPEEPPREPAEPPVPEVVPEVVPEPVPERVPELVLPRAASVEGTGAPPSSSPVSPSLSASAPELCSAPPAAPEPSGADPPGEPGRLEPVAVLRRDGSAPVRLAARTVRVQQARSVPVVPPKPQFAKVPPALQPWAPPANGAATEGDAAPAAPAAPRPTVPEGPGPQLGAEARRAGWREGGSTSFDEAVAVAAEQPPGPVRRIQTYGGGGGGGEVAPAAPKALPFHKAPLRPRLLRPLSCVAAPEGEGAGRARLSLTRPAAQAEGAALPPPRQPVGTEGAAGER